MRPADRVIVAAAAALVAASWLALWRPAAAGDAVRVSVPGAEATEFPLADDREVAVDGLLGRSTLEIRAGRVTVVVLMRYGWATAAWVAGLRVVAGSLLVGTFLSPTFVMSASGAASALAVLGLTWQAGRDHVGAVGYSVLAALAHMGTQVLVARALFIPHDAILKLLPFLLTAALVFGIVSGMIAASVLEILERREAPGEPAR